MADVDLGQLSPEVQAAIAAAVAKAVDAATHPQVVELSPQDKLAAMHDRIAAAFRAERVAPSHNDHILGAIEAFLQELYDQIVPVLFPPSVPNNGADSTNGTASSDAPADAATAPQTGN